MKVAVATLAMRNGYRTRPLVRLRKHGNWSQRNFQHACPTGHLDTLAGMGSQIPVHLQMPVCTVPPVHMLQHQLQQECHSQQEHLRNKRQRK